MHWGGGQGAGLNGALELTRTSEPKVLFYSTHAMCHHLRNCHNLESLFNLKTYYSRNATNATTTFRSFTRTVPSP